MGILSLIYNIFIIPLVVVVVVVVALVMLVLLEVLLLLPLGADMIKKGIFLIFILYTFSILDNVKHHISPKHPM